MLRARDFRQRAWSALTGKWGIMVLITLIVSLIGGACAGLSWFVVGAVAGIIITGPLMLGLAFVNLKVARGGYAEIGDTFEGFKNFANSFILYLLNTVFVALWSLLLVVPGIIKSYSYSMGFYILSDNPTMDPNTARKTSMQMMNGNKWRLFCLDCSFIGWYLLCVLTFGILSFWVAPYHEAARAQFYLSLKEGQNAANVNGGFAKAENNGGAQGGATSDGDSVYGKGYQPDPDIELGGKTLESDDKKDNGGNGGESQPPLNADDL